ncbi:unnamed protein product [Musa textilis]
MISKKDHAWKYNYLKDPKDPNAVTCMFCDKTTKGGIFCAKHLVGNFKNTTAYKKCPIEIKKELLSYMNEKKIQKNESYGNLLEDDVEHLRDEEEDCFMSINPSGKKNIRQKEKKL